MNGWMNGSVQMRWAKPGNCQFASSVASSSTDVPKPNLINAAPGWSTRCRVASFPVETLTDRLQMGSCPHNRFGGRQAARTSGECGEATFRPRRAFISSEKKPAASSLDSNSDHVVTLRESDSENCLKQKKIKFSFISPEAFSAEENLFHLRYWITARGSRSHCVWD